jgi:YbgC/YbaW family acyl-CoA thioester hydrolase
MSVGPDAPADAPRPASIRIFRRIGWIDTDAAGIYHWNTVFRLAEQAEAELFTALGIAEEMFGATPRLSVEMDFSAPLEFNDRVAIDFAIAQLGRSSIRFSIEVSREQVVAASGALTICLVDRETRRPTPLPAAIRHKLATGGLRTSNDCAQSESGASGHCRTDLAH